MDENKVVLVRRDTGEKLIVFKHDIIDRIRNTLEEIQNKLFQQACKFRDANTYTVSSYEDFKEKIKIGGFIRCGWDGEVASEIKIKDETSATIRCIPFDSNPEGLKCVFSNKKARHEVIFAKAY